MKDKEKVVKRLLDNKGDIPHHLPMDDGNLIEVTEYLLKKGFSRKEINVGVVWVTDRQHRRIHKLESRRFDIRRQLK